MIKMKTITDDDEEKYQENDDIETESEYYDEEDEVGILLTGEISDTNKWSNGSRKYVETESNDYHEEDCIVWIELIDWLSQKFEDCNKCRKNIEIN